MTYSSLECVWLAAQMFHLPYPLWNAERFALPNVTKPTKGSMANTLNDGTQLGTFTFDALSWYTGNLCSDSFLPGGKVADFFGFQYLIQLS